MTRYAQLTFTRILGSFLIAFTLLQIGITPGLAEETDEDLLLLARINRAFTMLVNRALPSIVQIDTTKITSDDPHQGIRGFPFQLPPPGEPHESLALGSGVVISEDGYILTNNHVVEDAEEISVTMADKRQLEGILIGTDKYTEIALIKVDTTGLPALALGDSDALQVGEWVIAIGSPFRLEQTVTRGIVSAKGRSHLAIIDRQGYEDFIQTDAAINPGNSGGALLNIRGELIGINTAILTGGLSRSNAGVGFAVPINLAKTVMDSLKRDGRVVRGWLGVGIDTVEEEIAQQLNLPEVSGVMVNSVFANGPAEQAGIQLSDVIVSFDGKPIRDTDELRNVVAMTEVGRAIEVQIIREGKPMGVQVQIAERTEDVLAQAEQGNPNARPNFRQEQRVVRGLEVETLTPKRAEDLSYEGLQGVIVTRVEPDSPAAVAGIHPGDLIQEIEMQDVKDGRAFGRVLRSLGDTDRVILYVRSPNGEARYVVVKVEE